MPLLQNQVCSEMDIQKPCKVDCVFKKECCKKYKRGKRCKSCPKKKD